MAKFPELIPYFAALYDAPAGLHYGDQRVPAEQSQHGAQQGCTYGTFLHGLSQQRRAAQLIELHGQCTILLLADDVFVVGPPEAAAAAFNDYCISVGTPVILNCGWNFATVAS